MSYSKNVSLIYQKVIIAFELLCVYNRMISRNIWKTLLPAYFTKNIQIHERGK
jgi:hypothetical protein